MSDAALSALLAAGGHDACRVRLFEVTRQVPGSEARQQVTVRLLDFGTDADSPALRFAAEVVVSASSEVFGGFRLGTVELAVAQIPWERVDDALYLAARATSEEASQRAGAAEQPQRR
ncbi:MAG: hypothetical protein V3U67_10625 [Gemmatimonadota bacterium]